MRKWKYFPGAIQVLADVNNILGDSMQDYRPMIGNCDINFQIIIRLLLQKQKFIP